ncbi:MAG: hypothetical protein JJT81_09315 [Rubellimicrobium sp.]|nr:hypothetical protein [Rubellimicrobium sp.]
MTSDIYIVIGLILLVLAVPAIFSAMLEGRAPRSAAILVLVGGGLVALAVYERPNTYTLSTLPDVFMRTLGRLIN